MGERCGIRHAFLLPYIFPFAEYCVFLNCICRSPLPDSVKFVLEEGINLYKLHTNRHGRLVLRSSKPLSPLVDAIRNLVSPPRFFTCLDWLILWVLWPCESNKFWGNLFSQIVSAWRWDLSLSVVFYVLGFWWAGNGEESEEEILEGFK